MHQHFELGAQDTNTLLNIPIWLGPMWSNSRRQHTHLTALFPGVPRWAGTRKVKPIWILLKRDSEWQWHQLGHVQVSTSLQTDNHTSTPPLFYRPDALPAAQPTASKHWRHARWSNSRRRQVKQNMRESMCMMDRKIHRLLNSANLTQKKLTVFSSDYAFPAAHWLRRTGELVGVALIPASVLVYLRNMTFSTP